MNAGKVLEEMLPEEIKQREIDLARHDAVQAIMHYANVVDKNHIKAIIDLIDSMPS